MAAIPSLKRVVSAATTNATLVRAGDGFVYGATIFNTSAAVKFVKLYNKATAPTVGTDTPIMTIAIAAGAYVNLDFSTPIPYSLGLGLATTLKVEDANAEAVAANDLLVHIYYS